MSGALLATAAAIGGAHLLAYHRGLRATAGVLKAIPILLLAWGVPSTPSGVGSTYARLVAAGLVLSAVGDVSLVFRSGFLAGLAGFFLAHCCYIGAFGRGGLVGGTLGIVALVVLATVAGTMLRYLGPHVGRARAPVAVYGAALSAMVWCAIGRALLPGTPVPSGVLAAVGAASFLVSDGVLAVDRFARPFAGAHAVVMVTYYVAQALIAASVV